MRRSSGLLKFQPRTRLSWSLFTKVFPLPTFYLSKYIHVFFCIFSYSSFLPFSTHLDSPVFSLYYSRRTNYSFPSLKIIIPTFLYTYIYKFDTVELIYYIFWKINMLIQKNRIHWASVEYIIASHVAMSVGARATKYVAASLTFHLESQRICSIYYEN